MFQDRAADGVLPPHTCSSVACSFDVKDIHGTDPLEYCEFMNIKRQGRQYALTHVEKSTG